MKKITSIFFAVAIMSITSLFGQVLPEVQANFNDYTSNALQEKLFVHTDKNGYTAGEVLWFKLFNVDGIFMKPLGLSKVAYVEVLDDKQTPVLQTKIAMKDGSGNGSLYIPVNLPTGNFVLRAYTSWMKNFGPDYYFSKKLVIINPLKSPVKEAKTPLAAYDIQFFPEGGHLVSGIASVVGVKAADQFGKGVNFKGAIVNQNNDTVARFEPLKFGIGRFVFKPQSNTSYRAVIKIDGKLIQKDIPAISDKGYVMSLKDNGNGQLSVSVNTNLPDGNVFLFVQSHQVVKAVQSSAVTNGTASFILDKSRLGEGISQITIFSADKRPVCERLYFKRPTKKLSISAGASAAQYAMRKKADVTIATQGAGNKPAAASLSVSVYRMDSLQHNQQEDILSYLWLKSDLRGDIESPGYYFNDKNAVATEAADNLMLTQGWRSFAWDDILNKKTPAFNFLPELSGPMITATLVNKLNNQPEKDIQAYLGIPGKHIQLYAAKSDARGKLVFNMREFYGPNEIVVETNTAVDTNYHIDVLTPFSDQFVKTATPHFDVTPGLQTTFEDAALTMQVQNIYNGAKMRQFTESRPDTTAFYGAPYKTYLLDNYTRFTTMEEVMREYIREANVFHTGNQFHVKVVTGIGIGFLADDDPMMLIDGVPFFDMNKVFKVDPLKIRKLEDVPFNYSLGPSYEHGIFSFTSYKGDLGGAEIDPHAVVLDYEGLQQERQFYSPVYDTDTQAASHMPDFRNVLYWSPSVNTGADGKQQLSFYTSDQPGTYVGVIQGITQSGEAGSQTFSFEVKPSYSSQVK
ncbi:hypothetical protein [Mucilaginibacter ginsenosidivorax]|uniref:Macroglobulin domain-containing protein n=1 Tax=Mucilaginibacter ginsenosidivorax TaxID=862126 RepID=A0A5B8W8U5_9SPHI|nr:hypothetical protein [Mucilaginibacter ginsenosidivorax]QEC80213.1 hypothetical protein FSB76_31230 [Mucilaginibacter ginsenosidivorax]